MENLNHNELYLLIATRPHGEQIAIHADGAISIHDERHELDDLFTAMGLADLLH